MRFPPKYPMFVKIEPTSSEVEILNRSIRLGRRYRVGSTSIWWQPLDSQFFSLFNNDLKIFFETNPNEFKEFRREVDFWGLRNGHGDMGAYRRFHYLEFVTVESILVVVFRDILHYKDSIKRISVELILQS